MIYNNILAASSGGDAGTGFVVLTALAALYFLPSMIAHNRRHDSRQSIVALNLFLGWTLLGWVAALVWALHGPGNPAPVALTGSVCLQCGTPRNNQTVARCWKCGLVFSAYVPPAPDRPCPFCRGEVPGDAKKCRHCGEWLVPEAERHA